MVVDSTALPEQVADAVVHERLPLGRAALFGAAPAGVHDGIADGVIAMLRGALAELVVESLRGWPPTSAR